MPCTLLNSPEPLNPWPWTKALPIQHWHLRQHQWLLFSLGISFHLSRTSSSLSSKRPYLLRFLLEVFPLHRSSQEFQVHTHDLKYLPSANGSQIFQKTSALSFTHIHLTASWTFPSQCPVGPQTQCCQNETQFLPCPHPKLLYPQHMLPSLNITSKLLTIQAKNLGFSP